MEKDYFKDRPESIKYNKNLYRGCHAFICLKKMQPFAKEISDLTLVKVTNNLTSQPIHPRGQKIRGELINIDKYGNKKLLDSEEVVGRATYILDENGWSLDTKDGKKFIIYNSNEKKINILPYNMLKGFMKIFIIVRAERVSFKIPICKFTYFHSVLEAESFIEKLYINDITYLGERIIINLNNNIIFEDDISMFFDDKPIYDNKEVFDYLFSVYGKSNNIPLIIEKFILEKIL